jgi:hypothetical protein
VRKSKNILNFIYSSPYETAFLMLANQDITETHHKLAKQKTETSQKIWNKYEKRILNLFEEIYKIKISEKYLRAFISLTTPISFSHPLTISLKHLLDLEKNPRSQRKFIYTIIHELAHYFAYTRPKDTLFNKLHSQIQELNLLDTYGANMHYLIKAVEFGIIGEVFGPTYADFAREWTIERSRDPEHSKSAKSLKKDNVPLDKTCLGYISKLYKVKKTL